MATEYPEWQGLLNTLARIQSEGFDRLNADEIVQFGKLYRRAAVELSFQRSRAADSARTAFLNNLVGQCYAHVYIAPRHPWPGVLRFFTTDFPCAFRRHAFWMVLGALLMLLPALTGFLITWQDKALAAQVLSAEFVHAIGEQIDRHHLPKDWLPVLQRAPAASFIMTNNIQVSLLCFAGGISGGVITVLLLMYNGLMLGIISAGVAMDGLRTATSFWAFVAPHGVIELSAIYIAGGAGLLLGYALINPGVYPRRVALARAGKEALRLILGVAAMLVVAGLIEGFFSPLPIAFTIKFATAGIIAVLLYGYLLLAGRRTREIEEPSQPPLMTPLPPV